MLKNFRFPEWVQPALNFPVRFCQVREDPALDQCVVRQLPKKSKVLMIGSGGCTIAALAPEPTIQTIHVVDPNHAQLALCRIKLHLLEHFETRMRTRLLGHDSMDHEQRLVASEDLANSFDIKLEDLGTLSDIAVLGLDYCGRYEAIFRAIRERFLQQSELKLEELLSLDDTIAQKNWLTDHPFFANGLADILNEVMDLPILQKLFGSEATRNRITDFSKHFHERTLWCLNNFKAQSNPYLWQMLMAKNPLNHSVMWLQLPQQQSKITYRFLASSIQDYLVQVDEKFDYIHLSNVLDWLSEEEAHQLLESVWNILQNNGYTLIRQLNSDLAIRQLGDRFLWHSQESARLHANDRSFFYRTLHLGQKRV